MYKNILVPMALDHDVSPQALALARVLLQEGGKITALHVYEMAQGSVQAYLGDDVVKEGFENAKVLLATKLADVSDVEGKIVAGHSARTIIDYVRDAQIDCVVIGSHKPGLSDYFLGSTASRVVRHVPCAVHVHRS